MPCFTPLRHSAETLSPLRLFVNVARHVVRNVNPCTSVLTYLREHLHLAGTKEGRNEGGISADDQLQVRPTNACISAIVRD